MKKKIGKTKKNHSPKIIKVYYHNGRLWYKTPYVNNKKHGVAGEWYEDGKIARERVWISGKQHGPDTMWHENGQKLMESYRIHGSIFAEIKWDKQGNVTSTYFPDLPPITTPDPDSKNHINPRIR